MPTPGTTTTTTTADTTDDDTAMASSEPTRGVRRSLSRKEILLEHARVSRSRSRRNLMSPGSLSGSSRRRGSSRSRSRSRSRTRSRSPTALSLVDPTLQATRTISTPASKYFMHDDSDPSESNAYDNEPTISHAATNAGDDQSYSGEVWHDEETGKADSISPSLNDSNSSFMNQTNWNSQKLYLNHLNLHDNVHQHHAEQPNFREITPISASASASATVTVTPKLTQRPLTKAPKPKQQPRTKLQYNFNEALLNSSFNYSFQNSKSAFGNHNPPNQSQPNGTLFAPRKAFEIDQSVNLMDSSIEQSSRRGSITRHMTPPAKLWAHLFGPKHTTTKRKPKEHRNSTLNQAPSPPSSTSSKPPSITNTFRKCKNNQKLILLCGIFVIGIAFVAVAATMSVKHIRAKAASSPSNPKTIHYPTFAEKDLLRRKDAFVSAFLRLQVTTPKALSDPDTGAAQALQWLVRDDPLQVTTTDPDDILLARFALASLYFSTSTTSTTSKPISWNQHDHWMTQASVCDWYGVTCVDPPTAAKTKPTTFVSQLNLTHNELKGSLPYELKALRHLRVLDLSHNELTGSITGTTTTAWTQLQRWRLHANRLQGKLPWSFPSAIQEITWSQNQLTGPLPSSLWELSRLQVLSLQNNLLTGSLPDQECRMDSLKYLQLHSNRLQGTLSAAAFPSMTNLVELSLADNDLTGSIPMEFIKLSRLEVLRLGLNDLEGPIPKMFHFLRKLTELQLGGNRFRTALPSDMEFLTNLKRLSIESNGMTGTIPKAWDGMTKLQVLRAHDNDLVGSLNGEIFSAFTDLQQLWLHSNLMVGTIPTELGSLGNLKVILLQSNNFRGNLPSELGKLVMLERLVVDKNHLSGSVSSAVCDLTSGNLKAFEMDCKTGQYECSCCTKCS